MSMRRISSLSDEQYFSHRSKKQFDLNHSLRTCLDGVFVAIIAVAPLFMGGRYATGRLVYVALATALGVLWLIQWAQQRSECRQVPGMGLVVAALLVVGIQIVPLPPHVVESLSPAIAEKLPIVSGESADLGLPAWDRISLAPNETLGGLITIAAYGLLYWVASQRLQSWRDIKQLLYLLSIAAIVMAVVGLAQYVVGNGKYFWIYENPFRRADASATGTFYNNNHFAHLLALGAGPLIWWLATCLVPQKKEFSSRTKGRSHSPYQQWLSSPWVPSIGLGLVLFAVILSTSRGGLLAMLAAGGVTTLLLWRTGQIGGRAFASIASMVVLIGLGLSVHGMTRFSAGVETLTTGSWEELDPGGQRLAVWKANLAAIPDFWLFGSGVGSHEHLIPIYLDRDYGVNLTHAESSYLQIALETGVVGVLLLVCTLAMVGRSMWRAWKSCSNSKEQAVLAALFGMLAASGFHAIWDFVWHIPALMAMVVLALAGITRVPSLGALEKESAEELPQQTGMTWSIPTRWGIAGACALVGMLMIDHYLGPALAAPAWNSYLRQSVAKRMEQKSLHVPEDADVAFAERLVEADLSLSHLQQAAEHNSQDARVHLRLAAAYMMRFELALSEAQNEMPIHQIREAAEASQFESEEELHDWLNRAFGQPVQMLVRAYQHCHRAIELRPLDGEAYLYLSDLSFLRRTSPEKSQQYLAQAEILRPHDGDVLLRAGMESVFVGDVETAIAKWKAAYALGLEYQRKLVKLLAGRLPIPQLLAIFDPDLEVLFMMENRYRHLGYPHELFTLRQHYALKAALAAKGQEGLDRKLAGEYWATAHRLYREVGQFEAASAAGLRAVAFLPHDYQTRLHFGRYLLSQEQFDLAEHHLQWCLDRQPSDENLREDVRLAMEGRMRTARGPATASPGSTVFTR